MTVFGGVRVYFGAASGSSQKALRSVNEPDVMISATTRNNRPWNGIGRLFVDSGGYSLMLDTGEHPPVGEYLNIVDRMGADVFATQDYPCEPEILDEYGRTVEEHQRLTTERARKCIDAAESRLGDIQPLVVVQGWEPREYLAHIDMLRGRGLLTDHVGIGSVCRRGEVEQVRAVLNTVTEALPARCDVHAFGVKAKVLSDSTVVDGLASVDTSAWYYRTFNSRHDIPETEPAWLTCVYRYIEYRRLLDSISSGEVDTRQTSVGDF